MAVTGALHKIVFGGRLALTEQWSCSIHFLTPGVTITDGTGAWTGIRDWFARTESNISSNAFFDYVKVNQINPATGLYSDAANANFYDVLPKLAGNMTPGAPHLSFCVSTVTDADRGLASKGRFYPPSGPSGPFGTDGRISAANALAQAVSAAQLITDLNGAYEGECVVFSKLGQTTREIIGTRVGRVGDQQHRRRRTLIEDHQFGPVS